MKRLAPIFAVGLTMSTLVGPESPGLYEGAAHIPPEACRGQILETLGSSALVSAVRLDISNSQAADRPTNSDNNRRVDADLLDDYPTLADFVEEAERREEYVVLPESGLGINLIRIDNDWEFSATNFDYVMKRIFSTEFADDLLRSATYNCYQREIYQNKVLEDYEVNVYLIGEGELCLGRKKVVPRDQTPDLCTARGRHRPEGVYILSRGPNAASSSLLHEIAGHRAQYALDAQPKSDEEFEYFAYSVQEVGVDIMTESDRWIFQENDTQAD